MAANRMLIVLTIGARPTEFFRESEISNMMKQIELDATSLKYLETLVEVDSRSNLRNDHSLL